MGRPPPPEALGLPQFRLVADHKGLRSPCVHHKAVQGSRWDDALQQKDSDAAIESFWRCKFVEPLPILWSMGVPRGPRGVPGASRGGSQGRAWGSPGSQGAPKTYSINNLNP